MVNSHSDQVITIKTSEEIELLFQANQIVAEVLDLLESRVVEGISTLELDRLAETYCRDHGALPAFKDYRGFPASLCASVNEEVVHGIPSKKKVLRQGDIVSLDFGVCYKGFYGDAAITVAVGTVAPEVALLIEVTKTALYKGIEQAKVGNRISDVSRAIQQHVEVHGFSVVRQFVGHGIGSHLHEPPEIPNFYQHRQASPRIMEGMVLAIEPMVNKGAAKVKILQDQWTVVTTDREPSAHFEHSVAIGSQGPRILSMRPSR
ncbi:MAG: type I methionyl aminopeptidase [Desulfobulbus sp.]|nr:type I methionyl aminopeptidase [Desulfobulbus sp.]